MRPRIGISLPHRYLCGDYGSPAAQLFYKAFGPVDRSLVNLSRGGIECIELSSFGAEARRDQIVTAVRTVWQTGLQVTMHPFLPDVPENGGVDSQYPWLDSVLRGMPDFQRELVCTVHAWSSERGSLKDYRDQTVWVLENLVNQVEKRRYPIRFALELNRSKGKIDPSTTYAGLIDICREVGNYRVGICWDWGHTQANVLKGRLSPEPPEEFLRQVINIHIHDLGPDGTTHWPLAGSADAITTLVQRLKSFQYSGGLILELYPLRFAHRLDLKEATRFSVNCLEQALLSVCDHPQNEMRRKEEYV